MSVFARSVPIERVRAGAQSQGVDNVAVEEPLEIRVARQGEDGLGRALSVTMRTPGHDLDLAAGFLYGEGLVRDAADFVEIRHCGPTGNVVRVEHKADAPLDLARLDRHFYTSSSCGVCGKSSIEAVMQSMPITQVAIAGQISGAVLAQLPDRLRAAQGVFSITGGLHAAGLFTFAGELLACREDVGRHNALDKLLGARLRAGELPLGEHVIMLSGRASFELLQKSMAAAAPVVAAIGAPSSLAIELAQQAGITLIGFLREANFNVYTHPQRIAAT